MARRCVASLRALPIPKVLELLESAARCRLDLKASRIRKVAAIHGEDQAIFQSVAAALGYRPNQLPMTVLAQRLPVAFLGAHREDAEALLFGVAGFLEGRAFDHADDEARAWLRNLWDGWWRFRDHNAPGTPAVPIVWNTSGIRPQNHPQRRIAALAALVARWREFRRLLRPEGFDEKKLVWYFTSLTHPYWDHHYTLRAGTARRKEAIVGPERIRDILANVILPLLLPVREDLWASYCRLRSSGDNEKTRRAAQRLFHGHPAGSELTGMVWQQQALLQIYEDFCLKDESDCSACPMPEQVQRFGSTS